MIRKIVFWAHLACGVTAGLVILMMSLTGAILTYERQLVSLSDRILYGAPQSEGQRLPIESLVSAARLQAPEFVPTAITIPSDPGEHLVLSAGRRGARYIDAHTGVVLGEGSKSLRAFFSAVRGWHRWLNAAPENRAPWRAVTGASNLMFLFLVLSGMYLWLPRIYKWTMFRTRLFLTGKAASSRARDFNWHHVLGIWSALPLAIVVATAVVFSYSWGNALVYGAFGETPPVRRTAPPSTPARDRDKDIPLPAGAPLPLDALFARAALHRDGWNRITMQFPDPADPEVRFTLDFGTGGQPQRRHDLTLERHTGEILEWAPFESQSPGRRARSWVRFLHTGEALGIIGQTVAGIVSLTSLIMVWTGIALAYRRLLVPVCVTRRQSRR